MDIVTVTQEDREAAAERLDRSVAEWPAHPAKKNAQMLRDGKLDDHEWVQEFARFRHRIAALSRRETDDGGDRDAILEEAAKVADNSARYSEAAYEREIANGIAGAIRALKQDHRHEP